MYCTGSEGSTPSVSQMIFTLIKNNPRNQGWNRQRGRTFHKQRRQVRATPGIRAFPPGCFSFHGDSLRDATQPGRIVPLRSSPGCVLGRKEPRRGALTFSGMLTDTSLAYRFYRAGLASLTGFAARLVPFQNSSLAAQLLSKQPRILPKSWPNVIGRVFRLRRAFHTAQSLA